MTLQVANGFRDVQFVVKENWQPFVVSEPFISKEDVDALTTDSYSRSLSRWAYSLAQRGEPLVLKEVPLDVSVIGPAMMRLFVAEAVLAFRVPADYVMPQCSLGRIVMMNYQPQRRRDPPVPLLSMLDLPPRTMAIHNTAIQMILRGDASGITNAIKAVLRDGIDRLSREEAFFYSLEMLSLVTGAYQLRYDTVNVLEGGS